MKVYVLGKTGMLGRYVYTYFKDKYDTIGLGHKEFDAKNIDIGGVPFNSGDVIINCIGIIKRNDATKADYAIVNSAFPHILSDICEQKGAKLIHITTDCVYDGLEGKYNEEHEHTAKDVYGMSKSVGEPENATVVRTSIIGEEIGQARSLVEWVKAQANKETNGFTNHFWNGITCLQFAKVCEEIIVKGLFWKGVKHVVSPTVVNKQQLVQMISDAYDLNIKVNPFETPVGCDRSMSSIREEVVIAVPELSLQIDEMSKFNLV